MKIPSPPLLVISDRSQARRPLPEIAAAAFAGGCRWFSLREKDLPGAERRRLLAELVALGRRFGATVTVHDDIDSALATGAGGVHLPGGGDPAAVRLRMPRGLIGVSAHSPAEAAALLAAKADYVTLSPIFPSPSKPDYGPPLGLGTIREAAAQTGGVVIALAGIDDSNAAACLDAGATGIAVMGEIMRAADPETVVRRLVQAIAGKGKTA
jgi:thiamine-phosphate pyrophosphorylase